MGDFSFVNMNFKMSSGPSKALLSMTTMVLQCMLEGPRPCTILYFNIHTTVEYLNMNVSVGQLLQHISKSVARSVYGQGHKC